MSSPYLALAPADAGSAMNFRIAANVGSSFRQRLPMLVMWLAGQ
jgi:hypothetical protein